MDANEIVLELEKASKRGANDDRRITDYALPITDHASPPKGIFILKIR